MPYLCTHLSFGARVANRRAASIEQMGDAYVLGCLGPDVYFFDRLPPTPGIPNQKKHGNALHALDAAVLFEALSMRATESLRPYLMGFLTHIALDSTLHPYIEARHTGLDHTRFEGVIDAVVYAQTKDALPYAALLKKRYDADAIDALLADASNTLMQKDVRGAYRRSVRKFRRMMPLLFDPQARRYRVMHGLERAIHKEGLLSGFLLAAAREDSEDAMNLQRLSWSAPWAKDVVRNESVPMLFDAAEMLALALIEAFESRDFETLYSLLRNRTMQKGVL